MSLESCASVLNEILKSLTDDQGFKQTHHEIINILLLLSGKRCSFHFFHYSVLLISSLIKIHRSLKSWKDLSHNKCCPITLYPDKSAW